jgi:putative hemolysin
VLWPRNHRWPHGCALRIDERYRAPIALAEQSAKGGARFEQVLPPRSFRPHGREWLDYNGQPVVVEEKPLGQHRGWLISMVTLEIALVFGLILLNGFFAMSELAIISARRARLQQRADAGSRGARVALELSDNPTRFLSTVQIGITLIGILAGAFSGATLAEKLGLQLTDYGLAQNVTEPLALAIVVIGVTFLSLVIGELVPKRFALQHADAIASVVAPAIKLLARLTHPAVALLQLSTESTLRLLGIRSHRPARVTDEEINALIAEGTQQGVIRPIERAMVEEVLRLADRPVRTIMTHRRDIVWLDVADTVDDIRRKIADTGYGRFVVCDGGLDNVLGYVRTRAIVDRLLDGAPLDLRSMVRDPLIVSPALDTLELMAMFRRARPHLALVVDEYGTVLGIATPADVLETIAGNLADDVLASPHAVQRDDGSWLVDAQIELQDLERALGAGGLATGPGFMTLAGLILERLGRIPQLDEVIVVNGWRLEVVDLDGHRIDKVIVSALTGRSARV